MAIGMIQFRRDTEANLLAVNAVILAIGEAGFALDKNYFALGDGVTKFELLPKYEPTPVLYEKISNTPDLTVLVTNLQLSATVDTLETKADSQIGRNQILAIVATNQSGAAADIAQTQADILATETLLLNADAVLRTRIVAQEQRTIPAAQVAVDWNAISGLAAILNKPVLFNGDYATLTNKPTIPAPQVASDWNAATGLAAILNKPTIPAAQVAADWNAASGLAAILNKPTIPVLPSVNNQTTFTSQATVPLVAQIAVGTAKLFKVGTVAPRWYANDAGVIKAI